MNIKSLLSLALALSLSSVAQTSPAPQAAPKSSTINVGIMLPLHDVDGDGRRMVEYYRGMLLAVEDLKREGTNVNIHAWNVPIDADPRTTLLQNGATECNLIFGPLYTKQVKAIGDFCRAYNINMVIPFSITGNEVDRNKSIYQVYESPDEMNAKSIQHVIENFSEYHLVFIDCNDTTSRKGTFTFATRNILDKKGIQYNITNLRSSSEMFAKAFSLTSPNLVILNTGRSPELRVAMDKLDILMSENRGVEVALYGYTEWLMYEKIYKERFAKYNTYIPTNFYYNATSSWAKSFEQRYRAAFHQDMMYALPHFAATGYDHAMFFIGFKKQWMQTPLKFVKTSGGGYRNNAFMLIHYKPDGGIDAVEY